MKVLHSQGEPGLIYVLLNDQERDELRKLLKGLDSPLAKSLRKDLKGV